MWSKNEVHEDSPTKDSSSYVPVTMKVNNYIVRSYRDVIVVTNIVTRRTSKSIEYSHVLKYKKHVCVYYVYVCMYWAESVTPQINRNLFICNIFMEIPVQILQVPYDKIVHPRDGL